MAKALMNLEELDAYLMSDDAPEFCMQLSDLDGFLTGIAVSPVVIDTTEWQDQVWGGEPRANPAAFERANATVKARFDEINRMVDDPEGIEPLYWEGEDGAVVADDWAEGFFEAIKLRQSAWEPLLQSADHTHLVVPILVYCHNEDGSSLLGIPAEDEATIAAEAFEFIPESVTAIRAFWREHAAG